MANVHTLTTLNAQQQQKKEGKFKKQAKQLIDVQAETMDLQENIISQSDKRITQHEEKIRKLLLAEKEKDRELQRLREQARTQASNDDDDDEDPVFAQTIAHLRTRNEALRQRLKEDGASY